MMLPLKRCFMYKKVQVGVLLTILLLCAVHYLTPEPADLDLTRSLTDAPTTKPTPQPALPPKKQATSATKITTRTRVSKKTLIKLNVGSNKYTYESDSVLKYIQESLEQALKEDKGTGCNVPKLDPFAAEIMKFVDEVPPIKCPGQDLVKCQYSKCKVNKSAVKGLKDFSCTYRDIVLESDKHYYLNPPNKLRGIHEYQLTVSDHVHIHCEWKANDFTSQLLGTTSWTGIGIGFRNNPTPKPPKGRENTINVLILGFDSTSHCGFIRKMPLSYNVLRNELGATILNGYNVLGDGTPAALFPILSGKIELEFPEARKSIKGSGFIDYKSFIFHKLQKDGYRTAYFEDSPDVGTFQFRFNGFEKQPADHYLRAFYFEVNKLRNHKLRYCVGDTPQYRLMLNITEQFLKLDGKRFAFTFIADITHDDSNMLSVADADTAALLRGLQRDRTLEDTLLFVMGDHGPRFSSVRETYQGKLEERLPFMAIRLPEALKATHPHAEAALKANADVLTTPHDIHATILDALNLRQYMDHIKIRGADLPRAMTLLQPIPNNRSCSEAEIETHWCSCLRWDGVPAADPMYARVAGALLRAVNGYTSEQRSNCALRELKSVQWVMRNRRNEAMMAFQGAKDSDGRIGKFGPRDKGGKTKYQVKLTLGPGEAVYEAVVVHDPTSDQLSVDSREISRTSAYDKEIDCIRQLYPHLHKYCYCNT